MRVRTGFVLAAAAGSVTAMGLAAAAQPAVGDLLATRVATLLANADVAASSPADARRLLPPILEALTRLGARPATGTDAISEWRTAARLRRDPPAVWRGRLLGPAYHRGALAPAGAFRTEQIFLAGEQASVAVATNPRVPVRMTVSAGGANPCTKVAMECAWWPTFTQRYAISIENRGSTPVRYFVVID